MPRRTIQERLVQALIDQGEREVQSRSGKYRTFTRSKRPGTYYFLGRAGALRFGKSASSSLAVSESAKKIFLAREAQARQAAEQELEPTPEVSTPPPAFFEQMALDLIEKDGMTVDAEGRIVPKKET